MKNSHLLSYNTRHITLLTLIFTTFFALDVGVSNAQSNKYSKFKRAIQKEDIKAVEKIIKQGNNINCTDEKGNTLLIEAVLYQSLPMTEYLIEKGIDINLVNHDGYSAIVLACKKNNIDIVKSMLDKGADTENLKSNKPYTALGMAIKNGHTDIYNLLLEKGADINRQAFITKESCLSIAIMNEMDSIAWDLINKGIEIEISSINGLKALHHAIAHKKDSLVNYLIDKTEDLESIDATGKTALNYAIEAKNQNAIDYLIDRTQVNRRDYDGWSPLHYSIMLKDTTSFKKLLAHGANPNVYTFNDSISPLLIAAKDELDYFIIPMLKKTDSISIPLNSPEMYFYSAYLHWKNALQNKNNSKIFKSEKATSISHFNIALKGFKSQISSGRWKKVGIMALNVASYTSAYASAYYQAQTSPTGFGSATYTLSSTSHLKPGIEHGKYYRDKCIQYIEKITNSN